eukprot:GHVS01008251.1.p1 GENE.GHVS01008251.1~~GHVS01008251.1.p1  ORF type:complete len:843 (-),score=190.24 GHVS01008251.1:702-3110(-)
MKVELLRSIEQLQVEEDKLLSSALPSLQIASLRISRGQLQLLHNLTTTPSSSCRRSALQQLPQSSASLCKRLESTSAKASSLSLSISSPDDIQTKLAYAHCIVTQLHTLIECALTAQQSLTDKGDFEQAAKAIALYKSIAFPSTSTSSTTSTSTTSTSTTSTTSSSSIASAEGRCLLDRLGLLKLFWSTLWSLSFCEEHITAHVRQLFDSYVKNKNKEGVSRTAKLFYPLGIEEEGINRFIVFIKHFINEKCAGNFQALKQTDVTKATDVEEEEEEEGVHVAVLTKLFVCGADLIDQHQQNIEQEFGPENFILFCRGVQEETDVQALRILEHFATHRLAKFTSKQTGAESHLRDVDVVLEDAVLLSQRCHQFDVYLRKCAAAVVNSLTQSSALLQDSANGSYAAKDGLVRLSAMAQRMQEIMGNYITLEQTFMQRSLKMALRDSDEISWDDAEQLTSTAVEDTFFIMHKSVARAISGCDVWSACAVVNLVTNLLSTEVVIAMEENLQSSRQFYANYMQVPEHLTSFVCRAAVPDAVMKERDVSKPMGAAFSWTHSVNNIQACCDYLGRFQSKCEAAFDDRFRPEVGDGSGRRLFMQTLQNMETVKSELATLHSYACKVTLNILKCHLVESLRPLDSLSYDITQTQYNDYQVNDPFMRNFIVSLQRLHAHLTAVLNSQSVNLCIQFLVEKVCKRLENAFLSKRSFSLLGGVQVDADIRALMSFCSEISSQSVRAKFGRLIEFGDVVNLGSLDELQDIWGASSSAKAWRLSSAEIKKVLQLRGDFCLEDIKQFFSQRDKSEIQN